jgi:phosphoribosylanthranilate isomerase
VPWPPLIKFCGITNVEDAELALAAGAWALGMILWPGSPRRCELESAAEIAAIARRRAELAGVFVNAPLGRIARLADELGLTLVQLHGDEGPAFCAEVARRTGCKVVKAARVRSGGDIQALAPYRTDFHLLDSYVPGKPGGSGETFAWELARAHGSRVPLILSGGLTPENVGAAIAAVRPYAVDVASGVERAGDPRRKDPAKLEAFAAAVREAASRAGPAAPPPARPARAPSRAAAR